MKIEKLKIDMRPRTILLLCFAMGVTGTLVLRLSAWIGAVLLIGTAIALFLIGTALQVAIVKSFDEQRQAATGVTIDPNILNGTPVFTGTRVPLQTVANALTTGMSVAEIRTHFPQLSEEQVLASPHLAMAHPLKAVSR